MRAQAVQLLRQVRTDGQHGGFRVQPVFVQPFDFGQIGNSLGQSRTYGVGRARGIDLGPPDHRLDRVHPLRHESRKRLALARAVVVQRHERGCERLPGRREQRLTYRLLLPERGRYAFGPTQLNTRFPIGLVERGLILGVSDDLLVHPRVGKLSASWQRRLKKGTELVASAARQSGSFDDDFHRVREYQQGDDPRAIHWPTTARRGELIVREFRESRDRPLAVLVDLYRSPDGRRAAPTTESTDPADPAEASLWDRLYNVIVPSTDAGAGEVEAPEVLDSRVETALAMAATLCVDHLRNSQQSHVYCAVAAADPIAWDSSTRADLGGLLDRMAEAQPHGQASADSGSMLVDDWQLRRRRSEQVVWITTRPEAALPAADLPSDLIIVPAEESVVRELVAF